MRYIPLTLLLCSLYIAPAGAQSNEEADRAASEEADSQSGQSTSEPTLASLARGADFIGLVKVDTTEYETIRDLPNEGFAILRVLVTYRHPGDVREAPGSIDVYENGLGNDTCYYPERQNEGNRFLVFVNKRTGKDEQGEKKEGYESTRPGCMIPVFVTEDNRYALRYPIPGLDIRDRSVIRKIEFADPDAFVTAGRNMSFTSVDYMVENGWLREADGDRYVFTTGIYLNEARRLMRLDEEAAQESGENEAG